MTMPELSDDQFGYRGSHRPTVEGPGLHEAEQVYPDIHEHPEYYTSGGMPHGADPETRRFVQRMRVSDRETLSAINRTRGKPDAPVDMYRAAPANITAIHTGDWVTTSRHYAEQHAESNGNGGLVVHKVAGVPAKHLIATGDYIHEFGYAGPDREIGRA